MRIHTQAVKARIETLPDLQGRVFVGSARKADGKLQTPPYVIIHPADGIDDTDRLNGPRTIQHPRFTLHLVGSSADHAQRLAEAIKPLFVMDGRAMQVDVDGERGSGLFWHSPTPVQWDFDVPDRHYQPIELGFTSEPIA